MGDADKNNLFPEINPNIDQIIQDEKMIDSGNAIKNEIIEVDKKEQDDIFDEKPKVKPISQKKKEHLDNARIKSAETRRQKAEERKKLKEEEKARKDEEKRLRREATAERNRVKARERYYKQKEQKDKEKDEIKEEVKKIPKQIVKDTTPKVRNIIKEHQQSNNMDFNTFAKYMMRYETLKDQYNQEIEEKNKQIKNQKKQEENNTYHPKNYPLKNYYHKDRMKQFTNF